MPKYSCFIQFSSEWSSSLSFICITSPKASREFSPRKDSIYPQQLFVCFVFWSCYINIKFYLLSPSLKNKNLLSVKVLDNRFSRLRYFNGHTQTYAHTHTHTHTTYYFIIYYWLKMYKLDKMSDNSEQTFKLSSSSHNNNIHYDSSMKT